MKGVDVVSIRVREGDEASCLNLNRAQSPRLLGVNPLIFPVSTPSCLKAPRISGTAGQRSLLYQLPHYKVARALRARQSAIGAAQPIADPRPDEIIPGIAGDANTAMWNLRKKTGPDGDLLWYRMKAAGRLL